MNIKGCRIVLLVIVIFTVLPALPAQAGIHTAPIIIPGAKLRQATRFPLGSYRLFRTGPKGEAIPIPFQIDEINDWGDYVLPDGPNPNNSTSNGIFDLQDELSFMGDDVGPRDQPKSWPNGKPTILYEIAFKNPKQEKGINEGAVYLGIYFSKAPEKVASKYVVYDWHRGRITTSRYQYDFDKKNYLILNEVNMFQGNGNPSGGQPIPILDSSTFFMKADLKYFLTFNANHRSIDSKLDAYKTGPVRTIIRVTFFYTILKLNFEIGMYTEVSFFTNSVILPAIIFNPIDGKESLNKGSGFYYGFALRETPLSYELKTNIRPYKEKSIFDIFSPPRKAESTYWLSLVKDNQMMYVKLQPSQEMLKDDNVPMLYVRNASAKDLSGINNDQPHEIEKSPINIGLYFDLTKFGKGEHMMAFQLFFENKRDPALMEVYRNITDWDYRLSRL